MYSPSLKVFGAAVIRSFAPIAVRLEVLIHKVADGVYEIASDDFAVRIRYGTGHRKDILVTLLPVRRRASDVHDLSKEIGLGAIAKFSGESLAELSYDNEDEYFHYVDHIARASERLVVPYLLGSKTDFEQIEKSIVG